MRVRITAVLCLPVLLLACAGPATEIPTVGAGDVAVEQQRQLSYQLQAFVSQNARLQGVFHKIASANAEFCGPRVAMRLGFVATTVQDVPERYRHVAPSALGLHEHLPTVLAVTDGGPAAQAGMTVGDVLVAIDGEAIPTDGRSSAWINTYLASNRKHTVRIDVLRQSKQITLIATPVVACSHPISLALDNTTNAFTDGQQIVVYSGLLRLTQSDAELATVVGHELAHINMAHLEKAKGNQVAGAIGGLIVDVALAAVGVNSGGAFTRGFGNVGGRAFATEFEREADYVGAYYVARAGFDAAEAEKFWRTLAQENPKQIFFVGIHPASPERFLLMQRTNDEIANKRRMKAPLRPELKVAQTPTVQPISSRDD